MGSLQAAPAAKSVGVRKQQRENLVNQRTIMTQGHAYKAFAYLSVLMTCPVKSAEFCKLASEPPSARSVETCRWGMSVLPMGALPFAYLALHHRAPTMHQL